MSTATSSTHLKQIKASPVERINGKIKIQNKLDSNQNAPNSGPPHGTSAKPTTAPQAEGLSPDQRRRVSGRHQMTPEEQKIALRKRVSETALDID